jgi:hypothetical protein
LALRIEQVDGHATDQSGTVTPQREVTAASRQKPYCDPKGNGVNTTEEGVTEITPANNARVLPVAEAAE